MYCSLYSYNSDESEIPGTKVIEQTAIESLSTSFLWGFKVKKQINKRWTVIIKNERKFFELKIKKFY